MKGMEGGMWARGSRHCLLPVGCGEDGEVGAEVARIAEDYGIAGETVDRVEELLGTLTDDGVVSTILNLGNGHLLDASEDIKSVSEDGIELETFALGQNNFAFAVSDLGGRFGRVPKVGNRQSAN